MADDSNNGGRRRRRREPQPAPQSSNRGLKIAVGVGAAVLIAGSIVWLMLKVIKKRAEEDLARQEKAARDKEEKTVSEQNAVTNERLKNAVRAILPNTYTSSTLNTQSPLMKEQTQYDRLVLPENFDSVRGDVTYIVTPLDAPPLEITDSGFPMPGGAMDTSFGRIVAENTVGFGLEHSLKDNQILKDYTKSDAIERRRARLRKRALKIRQNASSNNSSSVDNSPSSQTTRTMDDLMSEAVDDILIDQISNPAGTAIVMGNGKRIAFSMGGDAKSNIPDPISILQDKNSLEYCGGLQFIYIPPGPGPASSIGGLCIPKCDHATEENVFWRQPASDQSAATYGCRKLCKDGTADIQGFCQRLLVNPKWSVGYGNVSENKASCGAISREIQHWGKYCANVGVGRYVKGVKVLVGAEGFGKMPMACRGDFKPVNPSDRSKNFSCYQCPPYLPKLVGNETNGYLCTHDCPIGSSDARSGSTRACIQDFKSIQKDVFPSTKKEGTT